MPYYEVLCLANGRLNRLELSEVLRKACRAFMDNGGTVTRIVPLGADGNGPRKLAYRIRQNQVSHHTAFFVNICAFSSPATLMEVNRQLGIDERVLRHLAVRRPIEACMRQLPDPNDRVPKSDISDPSDPDYTLRKFMEEYERDFPDGVSFTVGDDNYHPVSTEEQNSTNPDKSVEQVVARLKGSARGPKDNSSPGLAWLSKLDKPDSS